MNTSDNEETLPSSLSLEDGEQQAIHITLPTEPSLLYEQDVFHDDIDITIATPDDVIVWEKSESTPAHDIASVETVETTPTISSKYTQISNDNVLETTCTIPSTSNPILYTIKLPDDSMSKQNDDEIGFQHYVTVNKIPDYNMEALTRSGLEISQLSSDYDKDIKKYYKRQKDRLKKAHMRANPVYNEREKLKAKERMKSRRQDPLYRELERDRDRIRRRHYRQQNVDARIKEREKDRIYRKNTREKQNTSDSEIIISELLSDNSQNVN